MNRATRIQRLGSTSRLSLSHTRFRSSRKIFHGLGMLGSGLSTKVKRLPFLAVKFNFRTGYRPV